MDGAKKKAIERAKDKAKEWNKFRISLGDAHFTRNELTSLAKMEKLSYYTIMPNRLIESGNLIFTGKKLCGSYQEVNVYKFTEKPIHYSVVMGAGKKKQIGKTSSVYSSKENKSVEKDCSIPENEYTGNPEIDLIDVMESVVVCVENLTSDAYPLTARIISRRNPKYALEGLRASEFKIGVHVQYDSIKLEGLLGDKASDEVFKIFSEAGIPVSDVRDGAMYYHPRLFSNKALVDELRRRGLDVKATQVIEL